MFLGRNCPLEVLQEGLLAATDNRGQNTEQWLLAPVCLRDRRAFCGVPEEHPVPLGMCAFSFFPWRGFQGLLWKLAEKNHPLKLSWCQAFYPIFPIISSVKNTLPWYRRPRCISVLLWGFTNTLSISHTNVGTNRLPTTVRGGPVGIFSPSHWTIPISASSLLSLRTDLMSSSAEISWNRMFWNENFDQKHPFLCQIFIF